MPGLHPITHSQSPVTTGTSVLGLQFKGGVILAADLLASYGSLARYRNCPRLLKVNEKTIIGCMGDYADFQYLSDFITQRTIDEECEDDGFSTSPKALHSWLTRVLYNMRSKFDPFWCTFVVGGVEDDKGSCYLGYVDKLGTAYKDPIICTGYGAYMATPIMRSAVEAKTKDGQELTEADARAIITECMKVMYYRDARAYDKYQIGIVTPEGARIEGPFKAESDWSVAHLITGYN